MSSNESMAAEFLSMGASAFAAYATNRLFEKQPELQIQFGDSAFSDWKTHFKQRVMELSAALTENEPQLFVSRINWAGVAFEARNLSQDLLKTSLVCLHEVLEEELPNSCKQEACRFVDAGIKSIDAAKAETPGASLSPPMDANSKLAMEYLKTVLEGDSRKAIQMIVDAVNNGLPVHDAYEHVLLAAQREVGTMWHRAEISVAEEHYVTSTTKRAMSVLCQQAKTSPANGMTIVAAAVAQNPHDIGIRAVSDFFEMAGWRVVCLGGDTPSSEFADAVIGFDANLALLSATMSTQLQTVRETINRIRSMESQCKIMVGGLAFLDAPNIWQQVGADAFAATLTDALKVGAEMVPA